MTRDDIIKWAREAGWTSYDSQDERFERFAALVATAEREACAMDCIKLAHKWTRLGAWGDNNDFHE